MHAECAQRDKGFEGGVDARGIEVAVKDAPNLVFRQSFFGGLYGFADAVGDGIAGGHAEEHGGAFVAIIPHGKSGLEVGKRDGGRRIEGGIDCAEAEDLGLGAAGGGAAHPGVKLAEGGIVLLPKIACGGIALEENFGSGGGPVQGAAEFTGNGGQAGGAEVSPVGKAIAALHAGPEAAIGKSILRFAAREIAGELALRDMSNEAQVGFCGLRLRPSLRRGELAVVPGAAKKRG